jgi:hypothetical protein
MTHQTQAATLRTPVLVAATIVAGWVSAIPVSATPQFARRYALDCSYCHVAPPRLNQQGEDFLARGYRFDALSSVATRRTIPLAVWNTFDVEHRNAADLTKGYPSRVEIISGGPLGGTRASYFIELRALSQQIGAGNRLLNRSGRFEDALLVVPVSAGNTLTASIGQFRALSQVDVSRRLSLSEPLALSASVPDSDRARTARLTSLRAFSPAGRQPAVRLMYRRPSGRHAADGWYAGVTLPLAGELTLPFTEAASFEFEARPKGLFAESYYRSGMTSVGGHAFLDADRSLANVVATSDMTARWAFSGALGFDRVLGVSAVRYSVGSEYVFTQHVIAGSRIDHRTGAARKPALALYANGHVPFGPSSFRHALRVQFEQVLQSNNLRSTLALSHVF